MHFNNNILSDNPLQNNTIPTSILSTPLHDPLTHSQIDFVRSGNSSASFTDNVTSYTRDTISFTNPNTSSSTPHTSNSSLTPNLLHTDSMDYIPNNTPLNGSSYPLPDYNNNINADALYRNEDELLFTSETTANDLTPLNMNSGFLNNDDTLLTNTNSMLYHDELLNFDPILDENNGKRAIFA